MIIGVPKELKNREYRVGLTPEAVKILSGNKHSVSIESGAGTGSGFSDDDFKRAGALIVDRKFLWLSSDIIVKVKEPLIKDELELCPDLKGFMKKDKIIFAFFHFPANPELKKIICANDIFKVVPYENIQKADGSRPILREMSKVAAEVSVDAASHYLRKENGGKGILLKNSTAVIIGCEGTLGQTAFAILMNRGAYIIGFDQREKVKPIIDNRYSKTFISESRALPASLERADLVICAAAARGEGAPKLITREMLKLMQPGSVIVDPSIDEGGCCETSRPTSHDNPTYIEEGIIHYCVANMPGAVPHSSTPALVKEALPYIAEIADKGWKKALEENPILTQAVKID